jgi:hypothetical protein
MSGTKEGAMATVYATGLQPEADQVRGILESCGIPARVLGAQFVTMQRAGDIRVVVPAERLDEARGVLKDAGFAAS